MKQGIARSGDVELSYSVEGEGGETVLLVMGLGGRAADWGTVFPAALGRRRRVVRFDHRGVGASPPSPGGYSLADMASNAIAVLDAVSVERAHVVGISMGGMIAQLIALEHEERLDRLALLATHFGGGEVEPPRPEALRLFDPEEFVNRGRDPESMMRFTLSVITAPGFVDRAPGVVAEMLANVRAAPTRPNTFLAQFQAILGSDRSQRVCDIRRPTLVVHGVEDTLIPVSNGRALAERIPGSRLELLDDVGHMPMLEVPERLAEIVGGFLDGG